MTTPRTADPGGATGERATRSHGRRAVLAGTVGVATGGLAAGGSGVAGAQATGDDEIDYGGWFDDVSNFEGTVDRRGRGTVTVRVGTQGNNGPYAFDPPAVRVDPGTTVVWEWTGDGTHDVATEDAFASTMTDEAGFAFEQSFDAPGIVRYFCTPHRQMGMKGAVVVGDPSSAAAGGGPWETVAAAGGLGLAAALFGLFGLAVRNDGTRSGREWGSQR